MISDTLWHLVIRVTARGSGMGRSLDYDLSDVLRHTQEGADPLAEWAVRRPADVGLWVTWHPLRGMHYTGVTANVDTLGNIPMQEMAMPAALRNAVLAGVELALRIDSGEFGGTITGARPGADGVDVAHGSATPPPSELIDPATLEITDGH